jgi:hypothetical protein
MYAAVSNAIGTLLRRIGVIGLFAPALLLSFCQASNCHGSILAPSIGWDDSLSGLSASDSTSTSNGDSDSPRPEQDAPANNPEDVAAWQLSGNSTGGQMGSTSGTSIGGAGGLVALLPPVAELAPLHLCQRLAPEAALLFCGPAFDGPFHPPRSL